MTINTNVSDNVYTVKVEGRLDTTTAPQLEAELADIYEKAPSLVLDFADLAYISSAGLRVLLISQKEMTKLGKEMSLTNVNDTVSEVLEITGFSDILKIN